MVVRSCIDSSLPINTGHGSYFNGRYSVSVDVSDKDRVISTFRIETQLYTSSVAKPIIMDIEAKSISPDSILFAENMQEHEFFASKSEMNGKQRFEIEANGVDYRIAYLC